MDFDEYEKEMLAEVPPTEALKTVSEIFHDPENKYVLDDVLVARLIGLSGDNEKAVNRLKKLRLRVRRQVNNYWPPPTSASYYIDRAIVRALGLRKGLMGIRVAAVAKEDGQLLKSKGLQGVLVQEVVKDGAADRAGIQLGDIIIAIDDKPVRGEYMATVLLGSATPGERINMTVFRQGLLKKTTVTLQEGGDPMLISTAYQDLLFRIVNRYFYRPVEIFTGHHEVLQVADLNQELRDAYSIKNDVKGAIILEQYYTGQINLMCGDVLTKVYNQQINSADDVKEAINAALNDGKNQIPLQVLGSRGIELATLRIQI
jgi:serine protease Do